MQEHHGKQVLDVLMVEICMKETIKCNRLPSQIRNSRYDKYHIKSTLNMSDRTPSVQQFEIYIRSETPQLIVFYVLNLSLLGIQPPSLFCNFEISLVSHL